MAQASKQPEQDTHIEHQQIRPRLRSNQQPAAALSQHLSSGDQHSLTKTIRSRHETETIAPGDRFTRPNPNRHSKRIGPNQVTKPTLEIAGLSQPSKQFANKCLTEFKALLESIKSDYHEDIKSIYEDKAHVDLFIKVGEEELKRPLHKCIIASRAFKFYCIVKGFVRQSSKTEEDIIVAELQKAKIESYQKANLDKTDKQATEEEDQEAIIEAQRKEARLREALEILSCELPESLINTEYLLNFARRAYLDQDLKEDEINLHLIILNWLKINRPELIKATTTNRCSVDHRESFRTVQPDFDQSTTSDSNSVMSSSEQTARGLTEDSGADAGDTSPNVHDDTPPVSSLTRTETFEMLSKINPDLDSGEPIKDDGSTLDDEDKDRSELSVNTSESSEFYTPVTRTGLKPKQFTPIVAIKTGPKRSSSPNKKVDSPESFNTSGNQPSSASHAAPAVSTEKTPPIANKSSSPATSSLDTGGASPALPSPKVHSITSTRASPKVKQTIVKRAHPISLERSQSPAIGSRGATKNFIEANKKMISQIEKKISTPSSSAAEQQNRAPDESENEISDANLLAISEQVNTVSLASQLDKFALVSYSKLANALSQMFIGEILTDIVVLTRDNKEINAHRCILAARSVYLNDEITKLCLPSMTPESPSTTKQLIKIDLTEFSYAAVYFSMLHIYSGFVKVPEDLELEELAKISHLLHVSTLRHVCMHNLKMNYCHYFHKPCNVCCIGVLKTLPIAWRYDLTELYSKCLQWIGAHFAQIFCLEEFSNLKPNDLIEECYKETLSQLTPDNVIQKTIECQKLLKSLPRVKWTESIICLVGRQLEDLCHYVADNYEKILQSQSFLNLGKSCWECEVLEENLLAAMNHLKPDSGCKTLIQLDKIECSIESYCDEPRAVSDTFANLISKMRKYCERYLLKEAASVVHCSSWRSMNPSLQKKIKDQALIMSNFDEPTKHLTSKPKLPSMSRGQQQGVSKSSSSPQPSSDSKSPSDRSTPDSRLKSPNTTYLPPPKTKPATARHVKVLK